MITSLFGSKEPQKPDDSADEPKLGFLDRMRQAVSRTRESFSAKISDLAALTRTVDESSLNNLESILLSSDLGVPTTTAILDALRDRARHQAIEGGAELRELLKQQLIAAARDSRAPHAAQSHFSRRRQRHWQNYFERQAGRMVPRAGPLRSPLRRGHIPRRGHRTA
jgi:signal recognition particle GTPase